MDARKAAAEARRAKLLARGGDRLAQITGQLADAKPAAVTPSDYAIGYRGGANSSAAQSAEAGAAPSPPPAAAASQAPGAALAAELTAAVCATSSTQELDAALLKSGSNPSLVRPPDGAAAQQPPKPPGPARGTATNGKWAQYEAPSSGSTARPRRRLRQVSAGETLSAAVLSTSRLRLLLAVLLALLLAGRWDAAAAAKAAVDSAFQQAQLAQPSLAPTSGGWGILRNRWRGSLQASALHSWLTSSQQRAAEPAQQAAGAPAVTAQRRQLLGGMLQRLQGQMAAATDALAGQQASAAMQKMCGQLSTAAAASPVVQQAGAALRRLRDPLTAAAASPAGQQVLEAAGKLPPLASMVLLDLSLVGAAALALVAAPSRVHSTLELDLQVPGLLAQLAGWLPGLRQQLSLLTAWQRLLTGLLDDAAALVVALVAYHLLPPLLAGTDG